MKSSVAFLLLCFIVVFLACQDTNEALKKPSDYIAYHKSVGKQIPAETGFRWMDFYNTKNNKQGRLDLSLFSYGVSASQIESIRQSIAGLTGIAFHYGLDGLGNKHIIIIPFDESLALWSSVPGRIYIDANTGNTISQSVANAWANSYKNAYPDNIWYHYFGANIFHEMASIPYFNSIDIEPAINDIDLTPQLLLIIWNNELLSFGRTSSESCTVYDASYPCPPCNGGVE